MVQGFLSKLRRWLKRAPSEPQGPAIPAGTIDTSTFDAQLWDFIQRLDKNLTQDSRGYRTMLLDSMFQNGALPEYSNGNLAYFYLGRFGEAYAFEYYLVYRMALKMLALQGATSAKVYSLGCGSMIDAWSLVWAADSLSAPMPLSYTGVDLTLWPAHFDAPVSQEFKLEPMQDIWDTGEAFDGNLMFLPKILSEVREDSDILERFCRGIQQTEFTSDAIALCVAYRSKATFMRDWRLPDWNKTQEIIDSLKKKGYAYLEYEPEPDDYLNGFLHQDMAEAESGSSYPYYYLRAPYGDLSIGDVAPDFMPTPELSAYLSHPSDIRRHCPHLARREGQYLEQNPDIAREQLAALDVCTACCPIRCRTRVKTVIPRGTDICFQVLAFRRQSV